MSRAARSDRPGGSWRHKGTRLAGHSLTDEPPGRVSSYSVLAAFFSCWPAVVLSWFRLSLHRCHSSAVRSRWRARPRQLRRVAPPPVAQLLVDKRWLKVVTVVGLWRESKRRTGAVRHRSRFFLKAQTAPVPRTSYFAGD